MAVVIVLVDAVVFGGYFCFLAVFFLLFLFGLSKYHRRLLMNAGDALGCSAGAVSHLRQRVCSQSRHETSFARSPPGQLQVQRLPRRFCQSRSLGQPHERRTPRNAKGMYIGSIFMGSTHNCLIRNDYPSQLAVISVRRSVRLSLVIYFHENFD